MDLHKEGKLETFKLKTGDMLFVNNVTHLHGRDEDGNPDRMMSLDSSRVVGVLSFFAQLPSGKFQSKEFESLVEELRKEKVLSE